MECTSEILYKQHSIRTLWMVPFPREFIFSEAKPSGISITKEDKYDMPQTVSRIYYLSLVCILILKNNDKMSGGYQI